jgi:hypothetical protein
MDWHLGLIVFAWSQLTLNTIGMLFSLAGWCADMPLRSKETWGSRFAGCLSWTMTSLLLLALINKWIAP